MKRCGDIIIVLNVFSFEFERVMKWEKSEILLLSWIIPSLESELINVKEFKLSRFVDIKESELKLLKLKLILFLLIKMKKSSLIQFILFLGAHHVNKRDQLKNNIANMMKILYVMIGNSNEMCYWGYLKVLNRNARIYFDKIKKIWE